MRVHSFYSGEYETLSLRLSDATIDGSIDSGGIADLPGVRFLFDQGQLGGLIGLTVDSPFVGRTLEWRSRLQRILGPILGTAEEAWLHSEDSRATFDVWEPEIGPQRALWAIVHNQIRVSFGRQPLQPLRTAGTMESLRLAIAGLRMSLTAQSVLAARGPSERAGTTKRVSFFLDPSLAAAVGLAPDIAIEYSTADGWVSVAVVDPALAQEVEIRVGQQSVTLAGRTDGPHRIHLSERPPEGVPSVQLVLSTESDQSGGAE